MTGGISIVQKLLSLGVDTQAVYFPQRLVKKNPKLAVVLHSLRFRNQYSHNIG